MVLALVLFLITYVALLVFPKYRAYIALLSAALFVALGILPISRVPGAVDWNVIMMIAGTMGTVYFFIKSRMPSLMADVIIDKMPNVKWVIIALSLFSGLISAFVDNVATVLMVAPVALVVSHKLRISPSRPSSPSPSPATCRARHPGGGHHHHPAGQADRHELPGFLLLRGQAWLVFHRADRRFDGDARFIGGVPQLTQRVTAQERTPVRTTSPSSWAAPCCC